jgi:hypothetical protein
VKTVFVAEPWGKTVSRWSARSNVLSWAADVPSGAGAEVRLPKASYVAARAIPVPTFWVRISSVLS